MSWSNARTSTIGGFIFYVRCHTITMMLGTQPSNPNLHRDFIASKNPDSNLMNEEIETHKDTYDSLTDNMSESEKRDLQVTIFPTGRFYMVDGIAYDPMVDILPSGGTYVTLPFIYDYQLRGSFKESISMLTKASGGRVKKDDDGLGAHYACADISSYKKVVDGNWFITNRKIPLIIPESYQNDMGEWVPTYKNGQLPTLSRPLRAETPKGPRTALATSQFVPAHTEFFFGIRLLNPKDLRACLETLDFKENVGMLQWRGGGKGTLIWTLCNKRGIPYDDLPYEALTEEDKKIIATIDDIIPGITSFTVPDEYKPVPLPPKKRGRKKKVEVEEEMVEEDD